MGHPPARSALKVALSSPCHGLSRADEESDRGGHDPKRLESQDDQGKYGSGEEADQSHKLIGAPQCQREIAERLWEDMRPEEDSSKRQEDERRWCKRVDMYEYSHKVVAGERGLRMPVRGRLGEVDGQGPFDQNDGQ